jgi:two-component system response regulator FixJ
MTNKPLDAPPLVYVVDDDPAVSRTIARTARYAGFEVRTFGSAAELLDVLDDLEPASLILDIRMPGMSGLELLKILTERRPDWPVIMLTAHADVGAAVQSFRSGAIHFLGKPFSRGELRQALEEASALMGKRLKGAIDPRQVEALQSLTPRERQVLSAIAEGLQSKAIAWKLGISVRTVDLHRSGILSKLSARNTSQAVGIARAARFDFDD